MQIPRFHFGTSLVHATGVIRRGVFGGAQRIDPPILLGQVVWPLLGGLCLGTATRVVLVFVGCFLAEGLASLLALVITGVGSADPIYTRAALGTLANIRAQGLAVMGPLGDLLHQTAPAVFADPEGMGLGLIRTVIQPGSSLLGRMAVASFAHLGVLLVGLTLLRVGLSRHDRRLVVAGIAVQLDAASAILGARPSLSDLESIGASFALNAIAPWLGGRQLVLSDVLGLVPAPLVSGMLVASALAVAYVPALALMLAAERLLRARGSSGPPRSFARLPGRLALVASVMVLASGAVAAAYPVDQAAESSRTNQIARDSAPAPEAAPANGPVATAPAMVSPVAAAGPPSHVQIVGGGYRYLYLVNGRPQLLRGMGLNTRYDELLAPQQRAERLRTDLAAMRRLGVNTVLGWDPAEFDETLLDAAHELGMGVVMPFELDPSENYASPEMRLALRARVLAWVARYQGHPALRMWGLGNEVLHKIVHPSWVGPQDLGRDAAARAFATWLAGTADAIHAMDPNHPVTYRDAEDAFVPWVARAFRERGGEPRPWFSYGTNAYTDYLGTVVDRWPSQGLDAALWVSEFAPAGMAAPDRPNQFRRLWGYIRRHSEWVMGGAVYAWTRNGPEEIDRVMGVTDDGTPIDGRVLGTLSELFRGDPATVTAPYLAP